MTGKSALLLYLQDGNSPAFRDLILNKISEDEYGVSFRNDRFILSCRPGGPV